jgi:DNA-binding MarR family transcriptional regulator
MEDILIEFINTLDLSLKRLLRHAGDELGFSRLTINQFHYIDAVAQLGKPTITEIAKHLNLTKASATIGVDKLVGMGYVVKARSNDDKRVYHVSITEAGERLVQAKYQALQEYGRFIRASLSEDEAKQFEETLAKLVKLFELDE